MDLQTEQTIDQIEIVRSDKRQRTVSARLRGGVMYVSAPAQITEDKLQKIIAGLKERLLKHRLKKELNKNKSLIEIAERLNSEYFAGKLKINSIVYTTNQNSRYGCCNFRQGRILLSHRLAGMPDWVRDFVIVHELAHLLVPNHSPAFHELLARYKLAERAKGFLLAKGFENDEDVGRDDVE